MNKEHEISVCCDCVCGPVNRWHHIDTSEECEETQARIAANIECMGELIVQRARPATGYWHCDLCDELTCGGTINIFLTSKWTF